MGAAPAAPAAASAGGHQASVCNWLAHPAVSTWRPERGLPRAPAGFKLPKLGSESDQRSLSAANDRGYAIGAPCVSHEAMHAASFTQPPAALRHCRPG